MLVSKHTMTLAKNLLAFFIFELSLQLTVLTSPFLY